MVKSILLLQIAVSAILTTSFQANAETRMPWGNNEVFAINKEAPHATLFPFQSVNESLTDIKEQSDNFLLLNGLRKSK